MDILHLSSSELDYELLLRKAPEATSRNKREKTGRLRTLLQQEMRSMAVPVSADHVMDQAEHLTLCNNMLVTLRERCKDALEEENANELAICRSKLLHYRGRLALITDRKHANIVNKLEAKVEALLQGVTKFLTDATLLNGEGNRQEPWDEPLLPDDKDLLDRLRNSRLQSSLADPGRQSNPGDGQQPGGSNQRDRNTGGGRGTNAVQDDLRDELIRFLLRDRNNEPRPQPNPQPPNFHNRRSFQPIHKWPFTYSGEQNVLQLATFLQQVKIFADTEEMDELTLLRGVKHLLRDRALEWYTRNYARFGDWEFFKHEIKAEFLPANHSHLIKRDMFWRQQGQDESFDKYSHDMQALFALVEPEMDPQEKFFILKSNLNLEFSGVATASRAATVAALCAVCKDYDSTKLFSQKNKAAVVPRSALMEPSLATPFVNRTPRPTNPGYSWNRSFQQKPQQLNVIDEDCLEVAAGSGSTGAEAFRGEESLPAGEEIFEGEQELCAVSGQARWNPGGQAGGNNQRDRTVTISCWQCGQQGHIFPNCDKPKTYLFCYRCGRKDTTSRNCVDCFARMSQALPANSSRQNQGNGPAGFPQ